MADFFKLAWTWIVLLVWHDRGKPKPEPKPDLPEPVEALVEPPPKPKLSLIEAQKPKPSDVYGQFFFREQILDQLDDYFKIVKRMRKADPQSYALYSKIGAHVMPFTHRTGDPVRASECDVERETDYTRAIAGLEMLNGYGSRLLTELSPWWKQNRPGFGAVAMIHPQNLVEEEATQRKFEAEGVHARIVTPRFVYFTKFKPGHQPPSVQRVLDGDIYLVTVYWQRAKEHEHWTDSAQEFPVLIGKDSSVHVLNVHIRGQQRVRMKRRHGEDRAGYFSVPFDRWGVHEDFVAWAKFHDHDVRDHLRDIFISAANTYEAAQYSMIRIDVRKGSVHAVFGIDVRRTPYFFRDRSVTLNEKGHKLRIFHIVRPHTRGTKFVKTHFRGERCFTWNGYDVRITVPGKHHVAVPEFDMGAHDSDEKRPGDIGQGHLGYMIQRHIEGVPLEQALKTEREKRLLN